jgi:hypothetical protein
VKHGGQGMYFLDRKFREFSQGQLEDEKLLHFLSCPHTNRSSYTKLCPESRFKKSFIMRRLMTWLNQELFMTLLKKNERTFMRFYSDRGFGL